MSKLPTDKIRFLPSPFNKQAVFARLGLPYLNESYVTVNSKRILADDVLLTRYYLILLDYLEKIGELKKKLDDLKPSKGKKPILQEEMILAQDFLLILQDNRLSRMQQFSDASGNFRRLRREVLFAYTMVTTHVAHIQRHINSKNFKLANNAIKKGEV